MRLLYYIIIIIIIIYSFNNWDSIYFSLEKIHLNILILIFLNIIPYIFVSYIFWNLCNILGKKIRILESFFLSAVNSFMNYISPGKVGLIYRAIYLKNNYNIGYFEYSIATISIQAISFASNLLFCFIISTLTKPELKNLSFYTYSPIIILATLFISIYLVLKLTKDNKKFITVKDSIKKITSNKKLLFSLILMNFLHLSSISYILYLTFTFSGYEVDFTDILFVRTFANIIIFFSIIPANLGILEGAISLMSSVVGVSFDNAVSITIIDRTASFITISILSIIGLTHLNKK